MLRHIIILFFISSLCGNICLAKQIDEKKEIVELYDKGAAILTKDPEQALKYASNILKKAEKTDDAQSRGDAYHLMGGAYDFLGQSKKALNSYLDALKWREIANDTLGEAKTSNNIGFIFRDREEYNYALKYYKRALKLHNLLGNKSLATQTYQNICFTYLDLKKYNHAIEKLNTLLSHYGSSSNENKSEIALINYFIGQALIYQKKYDEALEHLNEAVLINEKLKDYYRLSFQYQSIGVIYQKLGKSEKALSFYKKSINFFENSGVADKYSLTDMYKYVGEAYLSLNQYERALENFKKTEQLGLQSNNQLALVECYQLMADLYKLQEDYKTALAFSQKSVEVSNEFYSDELTQKADAAELIRLENNFALREQREANQASLVALKQNKNILYSVLIALFGMCGVALLFYHRKNIFQRLNREKYRAVGTIAHDLRSPLNHIAGLLDVLSFAKNDAERDKYIQLAKKRASQLSDLVAKTLDLNKLESGKINLDIKRVALHSLLKDLLDEYRDEASKKHITLSLVCDEEIYVQGDTSYLRQVYQNLISNAIKFSPFGKHVMVQLYKGEANKVHVIVKDEGPGISKSDQKKLFQHFTKLSARPTGGESSTGLGLTIVKKYVELMEGNIWCESTMGEGTTFFTAFKQAA